MKDDVLLHEARIFGRYLLGETPHDAACNLYIHAITTNPQKINAADARLLDYVHEHPRAIGLVDAGLNLLNSGSEVRRRIHLMFSILESTPHYHKKFLSQPHSFWYLGTIAVTGIAGLAKTAAGVVLVKAVAK